MFVCFTAKIFIPTLAPLAVLTTCTKLFITPVITWL